MLVEMTRASGGRRFRKHFTFESGAQVIFLSELAIPHFPFKVDTQLELYRSI